MIRRKVWYVLIYDTIEEAIVAAKALFEAMDTYVKITKAPKGGYELFGTGEFVMEITE